MTRHARTEAPHRCIIESWFHHYDGRPSERRRMVIGPYDSEKVAMNRGKQATKENLTNFNNWTNGSHYDGWSELIEIRTERVTGWEVVNIEFSIS